MVQIRKRRRHAAPRAGCCDNVAHLCEPRFFKALCDPNRIALLARLAECGRACNVTEISCCCPVDLSVVSRHLAILRDAGIVQSEKRGKQVYYSLNCSVVGVTLRTLADAIDACNRTRRKLPKGSRQ